MVLFLIILTLVVIGVLIYLATLEGDYVIERTKVVDADQETVFDALTDYKSWPKWSPWLMHEPETKLEFGEDNGQAWYAWDGQFVGSGKMQLVGVDAPNRIDNDLFFYKPFKSKAKTYFKLSEKNKQTETKQTITKQTEITWVMEASMPFFLRFMVPMIKKMVGNDYALGLAQFAGFVNSKSEHPTIEFVGKVDLEGSHYVCEEFKGHLPELQKAMETGYPKLMEFLAADDQDNVKQALAVYNKVNIKTMYFDCDIAATVNKPIENNSNSAYKNKFLAARTYFQVDVYGSYDFLELAWHAAMSHIRMHKIKMDNSAPSLEVYVGDPRTEKNSNKLLTSLYIPVK
jgi:effector-binding domain-containing protein/uncharacterized protein YndB with AHSA1/START domain